MNSCVETQTLTLFRKKKKLILELSSRNFYDEDREPFAIIFDITGLKIHLLFSITLDKPNKKQKPKSRGT
jgi:hypothetical protein